MNVYKKKNWWRPDCLLFAQFVTLFAVHMDLTLCVTDPTYIHLLILLIHPPTSSFTSPFWTIFSKLSHQPVLLFLRDPYLLPSAHGELRPPVLNTAKHKLNKKRRRDFLCNIKMFFSYSQMHFQMSWSKVWFTEFSTRIFSRGRAAATPPWACHYKPF